MLQYERQSEKEKAIELTDRLDKEWQELQRAVTVQKVSATRLGQLDPIRSARPVTPTAAIC